MLGFLFGWKKASKCKKLIKKVQCRLKLLKSKRKAIVHGLRDDIAQLLKNGHDEEDAFKRLQQLYLDENILAVYEMLEIFAEFITLNLSYIHAHKNITNDVNEAISTLIFASARLGDLPELRQFRKLFRESYGQKFVTKAIDLLPGNLVNCLVKENLSGQPLPENVKNKMVEEIVRYYFCKPGQLNLEYKPEMQLPLEKITDKSVEENNITCKDSSAIQLQSSFSTSENAKHENVENNAQVSPNELKLHAVEVKRVQEEERDNYLSENSTEYSVIYLEDVQEFISPIKRGTDWMDQDQRFFLFMMETPMEIDHKDEFCSDLSISENSSVSDGKLPRKRSIFAEKHTVNDSEAEIYHDTSSYSQRKCQKKLHFGEDIIHLPEQLSWPNVRAVSMPQQQRTQISDTILRTSSLSNGKGSPEYNSSKNSASPSHVHPKLPDYDDILAKFSALKKDYHQAKCRS